MNPRRSIGRVAAVALLAGLLAALPAERARAQGDTPCRGLDRRMDQVQRTFDRARGSLRECSVPEAEALLESAHKNFMQARDQARRGQCRRAELLLDASIKLADRAARFCTEGDRHREQLARMMQRTETLLRRARDAAGGAASPGCEHLLRAAGGKQERARATFRSDRLRLALVLTIQARELAERATRCSERGGIEDAREVRAALERTDRFLAETGEVAADAGDPHGVLGDAARVQALARRVFRERRHPALALRLTEQARSLAAQALSEGASALDGEDLERMIEVTEALLGELEETAGGRRAESGILTRARGLLDEARGLAATGRHSEAFAKVQAGASLALDVASRPGVDGER